MDLFSFFLFTQSVLAIIIGLFFLGIIVAVFVLINTINKVKDKIYTTADEVTSKAEEAKTMAEKATKTFVDFLVIKVIDIFTKNGGKRR